MEIIWDWGGEATIDIIARELKISIDYARLICESLARHNYIDFLHSKLAKLRGKGRIEAARRKVNLSQKKVVIEPSMVKSSDKKKKIILGY